MIITRGDSTDMSTNTITYTKYGQTSSKEYIAKDTRRRHPRIKNGCQKNILLQNRAAYDKQNIPYIFFREPIAARGLYMRVM